MKILILNGPNLNLLGTREPEKYGNKTLEQINAQIFQLTKDFETEYNIKIELETYQSNIEGELVNAIQAFGVSDDNAKKGIIINPAAYTHTSIAIRDAILAIKLPCIEVHLSNITAREEFRHTSLIAPVCIGQIAGFGENGYKLAMIALLDYLKKT